LLACWDCGFESRLGHGCLSLLSVVCCQVEVSATGWSLVQRSPTECGVSECDREASAIVSSHEKIRIQLTAFHGSANFKTRCAISELGVFHVTDYSVNRRCWCLESIGSQRVARGLPEGRQFIARSPRLHSFSACLAPPISALLSSTGFITFFSGSVFSQLKPKITTSSMWGSAKCFELQKGSLCRRGFEVLLQNNATYGLEFKTFELTMVTVRTTRPNMQKFYVLATEGIMFLGTFPNCEKRILASSCLSASLSVPHGTTRLPVDGFSWNVLFEDFSQVEKIQSFLKIWQE
jgi:hypothetical protein